MANTTIPYRLRIGVTGHRQLSDHDALMAPVQDALNRVRELASRADHLPVHLHIISPLAEGADRLVARAALADENTVLSAPLPMPLEQYLEDFKTDESKSEFHELLDRATHVTVMPESETSDEAYEITGKFVVERSDVLIALWDGKPARGQGGTGAVVEHARQAGEPVIWVSAEPPYRIEFEPGDGIDREPVDRIASFNKSSIGTSKMRSEIERESREIVNESQTAEIEPAKIQPHLEWILPYQTKADAIAQRYQALYFAFSTVLFLTAALAVIVIAGQLLFFPDYPKLIWIEVGLMVTLLAILYLGRRWQLQRMWLSHRFLAERFRAALYIGVVDQEDSSPAGSESTRAGASSDDWLGRAFEEVWRQRPRPLVDQGIDHLRTFLASAWVQNQADYHQRAAHHNERRHRQISYAIAALFGATLLAAMLHALEIGGHDEHGSVISVSNVLIMLALSLPALAGSLSGIRAQREYERNAANFNAMAPVLRAIADRIRRAPDVSTLRLASLEAESTMLEENQDWFTVMKFHDFELHV